MRVTEGSNLNSIKEDLVKSRDKLQGLQQEARTQKKIQSPADDPGAAVQLLQVKTRQANTQQFKANASLAGAYLSQTDQALSDLIEVVLHAKELAITASNPINDSETVRDTRGRQAGHLIGEAVGVGNRKIGDRYLFGGSRPTSPPIDLDSGFVGDPGEEMIEVGNNVFIAMNVSGLKVFEGVGVGVGQGQGEGEGSSSSSSPSLLNELADLRTNLSKDEPEGFQDSMEHLDRIYDRLLLLRGQVGARIQALEMTQQAMDHQESEDSRLSSGIEDADMIKVMSDLGKQELVYQSSLASSKKLFEPTLLDFLK